VKTNAASAAVVDVVVDVVPLPSTSTPTGLAGPCCDDHQHMPTVVGSTSATLSSTLIGSPV
jgi:hypothetical protein